MISISEALADEDNLEAFKTWLLVEYIDNYYEYLSEDYKDLKDIYSEQTESIDVQAKEKIINNTALVRLCDTVMCNFVR